MRTVFVYRDPSDKYGTFSRVVAGMLEIYGAEPSKPIPEGTYKCELYDSPRFKCKVYKLSGVTGHDFVEIHWGNFAGDAPLKCDTELCLLLGNAIGDIAGQKALLRSKDAFNRFMSEMDSEPFLVTIQSNLGAGIGPGSV